MNKYKKLDIVTVRKDYWKKSTKYVDGRGKPIEFYAIQDFQHPNQVKGEKDIFIPDGSLIKFNTKTNKRTVTEDWLSTGKGGPYKKSDVGKSMSDLYYLGGLLKRAYSDDYYEKSGLQVCSRPLNVLSDDCLDDVNIWIKK